MEFWNSLLTEKSWDLLKEIRKKYETNKKVIFGEKIYFYVLKKL